MSEQRLQKIIARAGIASRRGAEALIVAGRVRVNGQEVASLGARADAARDRIEVAGQGTLVAEPQVHILMHKPAYVVSTVDDPERRLTVVELLGQSRAVGPRQQEGHMPRVFPVGRLDFDAEGLILLTNDGELAHGLLHPSRHVPKTYAVKVRGRPEARALTRLAEGVVLTDAEGRAAGRTAPCEVTLLRHGRTNTWLEMTLFEGRNHQVKRMCEAIGHFTIRLVRTHFAGIPIGELEAGQWRFLTPAEVAVLRAWRGPHDGGARPRRVEGAPARRRGTRPADARRQRA